MPENDPITADLQQALGDRYRLIAPIGQGAAGVVYRARNNSTHSEVAIKFLLNQQNSRYLSERFRREAYALTRLNHPNSVRTLDVGVTSNNVPYFVMELVEGVSLRQVLDQRGTLPLAEAIAVAEAVCSVLEEAHRQGIIHRDIKPDNILIANSTPGGSIQPENIKVTDFGIAKLSDDLLPNQEGITRSWTPVGSPFYMSPEQFFGETNILPVTDIYALGCVLYEMVAGRVPFHAPSVPRIIRLHLSETPPSLREIAPEVPQTISLAVMQALEKDPHKRPSAAAFAVELRTAYEESRPLFVSAPEMPPTPVIAAENDFTTKPKTVWQRLQSLFQALRQKSVLRPFATVRQQDAAKAQEVSQAFAAIGATLMGDPGATPNLVGTVLQGRYEVIELLQRGGMGQLYLARHCTFETTVVLKENIHSAARDDQSKQQFMQEAKLLASLQHPQLPRVTDFFEEQGRQFMVMDYVRGRTLHRISKERAQPAADAEVTDWLIKLCRALEFIHGQDPPVIHCDIKPANVVLTPDDNIKLLDFGVAQRGKVAEYLAGTPVFMAPEQWLGEASPQTDLFSVGATAYYLLTQQHIVEIKSTVEAYKLISQGKITPLETLNANLPPALVAIVNKCLQPEPSARWQTATELRRALEHLRAPAYPTGPDSYNDDAEEVISVRLGYVLENTFPYPIALPFYQLRNAAGQPAEIAPLANILGATLQYLASVAMAEYMAGPARDPTLDNLLKETLCKPVPHGKWAELLRETLKFLQQQTGDRFMPELSDAYFAQPNQHATTLPGQIDNLVHLRNVFLKKSGEAAPSVAQVKQFKHELTGFLQALAFLKNYPLVSAGSSQTKGDIKTHRCFSHKGFHHSFGQIAVYCDLDLKHQRPALLNPRAGELLYLYPFYNLRACPADGCGETHLFRLEQIEKGHVQYLARQHALRDREARLTWQDLLSGWGPRTRLQAKYLYLEASGAWQKLSAGHLINKRYEIVRHLRRGGMADVYEARAVQGGKASLALKLLPFQFLCDPQMVQRFRHEAHQARPLEHPNITRIHDYGEDLADHFLVMELADGWPLADGARALDVGELPHPLTEASALAIVKQACEGLDYIHGQKIIHRDVKPGNLLLFADGRVKLADFGIARSPASVTLTLTGLALGTPEYMSPEQAAGKKELTTASDIYSLGVVLYELLTGESPFKRATPLATLQAHRGKIKPPRKVNPALTPVLEQIILQCLAKDPNRRFRTAQNLYQALCEYERAGKPLKPGA